MEFQKISQQLFDPIKANREQFGNAIGEKLAELFPSVVKDGEVDYKALLAELGEYVDSNERYELNWTGKTEAIRLANTDIIGRTLNYVPEESKNQDTTENLYIEGDNLEVLKLLSNSYNSKIKMIYIDPPYNTGNDFIYRDNFTMSNEESDVAEGDVSELGERLKINQKSSNRYHANWLSMMYSRLKVAKVFLSEDGVILVSIGDDELANLLSIMNEIFGEINQICIFTWKSRAKPTNAGNSKFRPQKVAEYIVVYGKKPLDKYIFNVITSKSRVYPHQDELGKYRTTTILTSNRGTFRRETMRFESNGYKPNDDYRWKAGKSAIDDLFTSNHILMNEDGVPQEKKYEHEEQEPLYPIYCFVDSELSGTAEIGKSDLNAILGNNHGFDSVKPVQLIKYLVSTFVGKQGIVLDFFSGSATTAQAVFEYNLENKSSITSLCVQYPETCKDGGEAFKAGYNNICEIGKERIRRAGEKIKEDHKDNEEIQNLDIGFKVFRVGDTNIRWFSEAIKSDTVSYEQLTLKDKNMLDFNPGYTDVNVVYEILLRHRDIPLTAKVEQLMKIGKRTYIFANTVVVCLEEYISDDIIDKIASLEPLPTKIIFRDSAFGSDISLKENSMLRLEAQMKKHSGQEKRAYRVEFI